MRRRIVVIAAAGVLAVAGVAGVAAQTGSGTSNPVGTFIERLAANLGVGEDELRAAINKTQDEMIDDAVAQGRISPEFGEALREHEPGERLGRFHHFEFLFRPNAERGAAPFSHDDLVGPDGPLSKVLDQVAKAAGTDVDTLLQGLKSGKSLEQIAGEHGVTPEQLKQRLSESFWKHFEEWMGRPLPFKFDSEWRMPSSGSSASGA